MDDSTRFEERLWYPTWPFALLLGFCCVVGVVEGVVTDTDAAGWIWFFAVVTAAVLFWAALLKLSYRRLYTRVGEHTLELMPGARTALYLKIDPPVRGTDTFLVATKRPQELLAAVQGGAVAPSGHPAPALG